ncbi:2-keto-4-pentenoate hydratase [Nocardioides sp. GXZ039]|uniref:2-keto-4-pentenoate hydratase n=1 Tax=Nocardioides sp. GXZ039 TaxID=3136018 RepID=UPI0030F43B3C
MTSSPTSVETAVTAAAERLQAAAETAVPCAPVRDLIGATDLDAAYAVQRRLHARRTAAGASVVGRKIGLTSPAVQQQLGVDQPDFGVLYEDMAFDDGATLPVRRLLQPRVEAEIAFGLSEDLDGDDLDLDRVRAAIGWAAPALEICDSRIREWDISFGDTVADNASAGLFVLGEARLPLDRVEPREVTMTMSVTGQETSTGTGAACLGDPLQAVLWLARQSTAFGQPLRAGEVILSGALSPMRPLLPGASAHAVIDGLGEVTTRLGQEEAS